MDAKLNKLLVMALRSDTNQHEAEAAFTAARRLSVGKDVDKLLSSGAIQERIVERVVYHTRGEGDHARQFTLHIPPSYQFNMMERVFVDGNLHDVHVQMVKCESQSHNYNSGVKLTIRVSGTKSGVNNYSVMLDGYIDQIKNGINSKSKNKSSRDYNARDTAPPAAAPKPQKGFWAKLFGK